MTNTYSMLESLRDASEKIEEKDNQITQFWLENIFDICHLGVLLNKHEYFEFTSNILLNAAVEPKEQVGDPYGDTYGYRVYQDGTFDAYKYDKSGNRAEQNKLILKAKPGTPISDRANGIGSMALGEITNVDVIMVLVKDIEHEVRIILNNCKERINEKQDIIERITAPVYNPEQ